ncbi:MAG: F0F1 ATP synthase subunit B' [Magnetovibrio sp.]|nr:F0F1 ATP synthase subunit B' [Magnetovibrio sp.]
MPQLDITTFSSQIFWLAVTFIALFLVMWRVAVPKIADSLEARQKRISDNLARAEEVKTEAEAAIEAYEASLAEARSDAQSVISEAAQQLADEAAAREAELAETLKNRIAESEASIAQAMEAAIANIRDAAAEVAVSATERLTGEAPAADDAGAAVDNAIKARG